VLRPCSEGNKGAKCTIGTRGECKGKGDYKKYIVIDRTNGFNCPTRFQ
jgi:hypothetical protein